MTITRPGRRDSSKRGQGERGDDTLERSVL